MQEYGISGVKTCIFSEGQDPQPQDLCLCTECLA